LAPSIDTTPLIPLAVFGASLLGSTHCVGMCGGLAVSVGRDSKSTLLYHLGRLTGYLWLGTMAGALGAATLGAAEFSVVSWIATALLAFAFIQMGVNVWRGKGSHLFALPSRFSKALHQVAGDNPYSIGAFSALLPCGWLHGFVLTAAAVQSPLKGALVLFLFWVGTVPALSLSPWLIRKILQPIALKIPKATAILLISAGVLSLFVRASPLIKRLNHQPPPQHEEAHSCH
jgi:sulfite exporter TauE/SafE